MASNQKVPFLYSGPPRQWDAQQLGNIMGLQVHSIDVLQHASHDLADHHLWQDLVASVELSLFDQ